MGESLRTEMLRFQFWGLLNRRIAIEFKERNAIGRVLIMTENIFLIKHNCLCLSA